MPVPPRRPPLIRKLAATFDAAGAPPHGAHLLVAVSGGPDSTALLAALVELAPARALRLTAAHVDHALRPESAAEASRAAATATKLGVPMVVRRVELRRGAGPEDRARRERYRALAAIAAEVNADWIVTGHTQDDQVETLLLRLLRGAGRRGLGAMRPRRGRLLRPLLATTRTDVRRYLAERALDFVVDPSNADLRFARNRIRRVVLPLLRAEFNPRLDPALAGLATRLGDEDDFLAAAATARGGALRTGKRSAPRSRASRRRSRGGSYAPGSRAERGAA